MHTRSHLSLLRESALLAIILGIGAGLAAFFFATQRPVGYTAIVSFDVVLAQPSVRAHDEFGGAYSDLKASEVFSQNAMSWMMTPAIVSDVYDEAAVPYTIESLSRFTNRFQTRQYGAQNFIVQFTEADQARAYALAGAVATVIESKAQEVGSQDGVAQFILTAADPIVVKEHWDPSFVVIIAVISGIVAGVVLTYTRDFFVSEHRVA
ncbi:MAG: hypothetical protein KIH62_002390 [Candidatus Kerfeldbacteria bacterium]|nr:hypothetical protein [Candidatus Kerfeldbacteria bacterium]